MNRSRYVRRIAIAASLIGVAASKSLQGQSPVNAIPAVPALVTSGQGEAKVNPDRASILVNVQTRALTAAAAAADNAQRTTAVLDALSKLGLPKEQLGTEGYSVYPEMAYDRNGGAPRVTGYVVTNSVKAETKRPAEVGAMVDAALKAGANMINSLSFYASSIEEPRRQAIALAVKNARADAEAMATAAGGSLGNLIELSTQGPTAPPRPMYELSAMRKDAGASVPTPVNPEQQTIAVFITSRWQFVPGMR